MRSFIYFSRSAVTSGSMISRAGGDLMRAGRMDITLHTIISAFFLSHNFRKDVKLHLVLYGPPTPPRHIEIRVTDELEISKKDIGNMIKKILYKYKEGKKTEVFPGCFVEKKSLLDVVEELNAEGNEIFLLDKSGKNIREQDIPEKNVFVLGDHEGLPKKELKMLKKFSTPVSVGKKTYFASQVVAVVNNEIDFRENSS